MAVLVLNDRIEVRIVTYLATQTAFNVLRMGVIATTGGSVTETEAIQAMDNSWDEEYKDCMSGEANYRGSSLQRLEGTPLPVPIATALQAAAGNLGGDVLPGQVAGVISWRTSFTGPSRRGRSYIAFPDESSTQGGGKPNATYLASLAALGVALMGPHIIIGGAGTATLALYVHSETLGIDTLVTSFIPRLFWGTQRRRGNFGEPNAPPF